MVKEILAALKQRPHTADELFALGVAFKNDRKILDSTLKQMHEDKQIMYNPKTGLYQYRVPGSPWIEEQTEDKRRRKEE